MHLRIALWLESVLLDGDWTRGWDRPELNWRRPPEF